MARAGAKPKVPPMKSSKPDPTVMRLSSVQILVKVDLLKGDKKVGEGYFGPQDENGQRAYEFYNIEDTVELVQNLPKMLKNVANGKEPE
jgi:hypothetical protein